MPASAGVLLCLSWPGKDRNMKRAAIQVIAQLRSLANAEAILRKEKKFGITAPNSLGIYQKDLNVTGRKRTGRNSQI